MYQEYENEKDLKNCDEKDLKDQDEDVPLGRSLF